MKLYLIRSGKSKGQLLFKKALKEQKNSFENNLMSPERKSSSIEVGDGEEFLGTLLYRFVQQNF